MKSNDDDLPEKKEKQGGSDKKQPGITSTQLKSVIEAALKPVNEAIAKLTGDQGVIARQTGELRVATDSVLAMLQADGQLMTTLTSVAESTDRIAASTDGLQSQLPEAESRLTTAIREASAKGEASQAKAEIEAIVTGISEQNRRDSEARHGELVGRFNEVDLGLDDVRDEIRTSTQQVIDRVSGLSNEISQVMREARKLKRRSAEIRQLIGEDGNLTRTNFGQAFSMQTDYLEEVIGSSNENLAGLIVAVRNAIDELPKNMSKELVGVLGQLLSVAQKVLQGATSITQHMEFLSNSTELAYQNQANMLKQMEAQAGQAGIRMEQNLQNKLNKTADALESKIGKAFENFDPDGVVKDLKENYETLRNLMVQYASLMDKAESMTGALDSAQKKVVDQSEKAVANIADPLKKALEQLGTIKDRFNIIQSGFKDSEESGVALVNRMQMVSLKAYQSELERIHDEAAKERQATADTLAGAFSNLVANELPKMIEEGIAKALSNVLAGVVLDDAEPTK